MSTRNGPRVLSRKMQRVQSFARKPATSFSNPDAVHGGLLLTWRTSSRGLWRRNVQPRRFGPDPLVAMNIGNKGLAHLVQGAQEGGLLAVAAVHPDPAEPHPSRPRRPHHLERESSLRAHRAR